MQNFAGTCAEKAVRQIKLAKAQENKQSVQCEGAALKNTYAFKYLGSIFTADGSEERDVKRRIAIAMQRMGALRNVFDSKVPLQLKLKIYKTAVCSLLTYGCEAWCLSEKTLSMINGANARCLSRFTGQDAHAEASTRTRTYDLVGAIRKRRFVYLGHILRMEGERLVKHSVERQFAHGQPGNMFLDVPKHYTLSQIKYVAANRKLWKRLAMTIGTTGASSKLWPPSIMSRAQPSPTATPSSTTATPQDRPNNTSHASPQLPIAQTYRARDASELFFRPATKQRAIVRSSKMPKKKLKPRQLTDKQRAAEAHAHFIIHHGTAADAEKFQKHHRIKNVCAATLEALHRMCSHNDNKCSSATTTTSMTSKSATHPTSTTTMPTPQQPTTAQKSPTTMGLPPMPTWAEAEAAVFSSSSDESVESADSPDLSLPSPITAPALSHTASEPSQP